jgi:DNA-binding MarR family transcriptional regulator
MANPDGLYNLLKELFFILDDGDRMLFGRFNLTVPRFFALLHLGQEPGVSSTQLSDYMLCDKSNITRLIKGMEADGLVVRRPHESDGRAYRLYLTDQGQSIREQALTSHKSFNELRFRCIEEIQQDNLVDGLLKLKKGLVSTTGG